MTSATLSAADPRERGARLYRMIWRWHFYAGLFCIPVVLALSLTGLVYLFRPEIEAWIDRDLMALERSDEPATQDAIVAAALASAPGSQLAAIVLPETPDMAARVLLSEQGARTRVYVHPDTLEILKSVPEQDRFSRIVFRMHGELLMGPNGGYLVELAACWAIVMILTGLYLWWPRGATSLGGVLYPRLGGGAKRFWRDIHAVTGVWVSALALFLLVTGLPWATVWGASLDQVRAWTGTAGAVRDWTVGSSSMQAEHAEHGAGSHDAGGSAGHASVSHAGHAPGAASIETLVGRAIALDWPSPVLVTPPTKTNPNWKVASDAANRPLRREVYLSPDTAEPVFSQGFSDRHPIDQVIGYGIAAHEGRLFGWANQALGVLAVTGLVMLCVSAFVMWRRRAPDGVLGAPPPIPDARIGWGLAAIILVAGVLMPLLGACLIALALVERLILARWPTARRWLGLAAA